MFHEFYLPLSKPGADNLHITVDAARLNTRNINVSQSAGPDEFHQPTIKFLDNLRARPTFALRKETKAIIFATGLEKCSKSGQPKW